MKPRQKKRRQERRRKKGWSRIEVIMLLTFLLQLITTIIDRLV